MRPHGFTFPFSLVGLPGQTSGKACRTTSGGRLISRLFGERGSLIRVAAASVFLYGFSSCAPSWRRAGPSCDQEAQLASESGMHLLTVPALQGESHNRLGVSSRKTSGTSGGAEKRKLMRSVNDYSSGVGYRNSLPGLSLALTSWPLKYPLDSP
jgi:hypothetical protein